MPANSPAPTLSQVKLWETEHLAAAATCWADTAALWESAFTQTSQRMYWPGDTPWEGAAANAAQQRAHADRRQVVGLADQLHNASAVAHSGADRLRAAQQRVLAAVAAAEDAGFTVGEDFSLTTYRAGDATIAAAEAQARELAAEIRSCIKDLVATDQRVAADITTAAGSVGTISFADADGSHTDRDSTIQAVDNRILKEAPPQPPPPDPQPGPLPPVNNADDVWRVLEPLQNGGKRGPNEVGTKPGIKEVWDAGAMRRLWDYLTRNATEGQAPADFKGPVRVLPDGTKIGWRNSTKGWGGTVQAWYPDGTGTKMHTPYEPYFPPLISVPPQLPPSADAPPALIPPLQLGHPPVVLPPTEIFDPNGLPPWLQDPSPPGIHVSTQPPMIMPGVAFPDVPPTTATTATEDNFSLLPEIGYELADAGKATGAAAIAGVVLIGGLLAEVANPIGEISR